MKNPRAMKIPGAMKIPEIRLRACEDLGLTGSV